MDAEFDMPSAKRRRLSIEAHNSPQRATDLVGDLPTTPKRKSFLSPTKASLSRFNPDLLSRRRSAGSGARKTDSHPDALLAGQRARAYVLGERQSFNAQPNKVREEILPAPLGTWAEQKERQATGGATRKAEKDHDFETENQIPADLAVTAREVLDFGEDGGVSILPEEGDNDLPLPADEAIRQFLEDTPPRGILWSSATKRARRNKLLGLRLKSMSPMRLPSNDSERIGLRLAHETPITAAAPKSLESGISEISAGGKRLDEDIEQGTLRDVDYHALARQEEKARLQRQLKEMEVELEQYELEIKRNQQFEPSKTTSQLPVDGLM